MNESCALDSDSNQCRCFIAQNERSKSLWYESSLFAMEIVHIILLSITCWVFLCMLVYGTKTGRWKRRPRTSRLNSGPVYIACFIATGLVIVKLTLTEILYHYQNISFSCETMVGIMVVGLFLALYGVYIFLWILQRLIYTHPYVKGCVSKCMNVFSKWFLLLLPFGLALSLGSYFGVGKKPYETSYGCVQATEGIYVVIAVAGMVLSVVVIQATMVGLFIYPAFQVRFSTPNDNAQYPSEDDLDSTAAHQHNTSCWQHLKSFFTEVSVSPIEVTVKRAVISCIIIVLSDVFTMVMYIFILEECHPVVFHTAGTDISSVLNVFCMLGTFGFAPNVLTVFCPTCPKYERRGTLRQQPNSERNAESNA